MVTILVTKAKSDKSQYIKKLFFYYSLHLFTFSKKIIKNPYLLYIYKGEDYLFKSSPSLHQVFTYKK
nr:MAG TPA: hypothetical protein [Caudoviricetes sp.]